MGNCQCQSEIQRQKVKAEFAMKYDYLSEDEIDDIYNRALNTYLDLAFPLHYDITEIPASRPRAYQWVRDCMDEIMERNGMTATRYSENGLTYEWGTDMVSDSLRRRIGAPLGRVGGTRI